MRGMQRIRPRAPTRSWMRPPPTVRYTAPRSRRSPPPPRGIPVGRPHRVPWHPRACAQSWSRSCSAGLSSTCSPRRWAWWPSAAGGCPPRSSCAFSMRPPTGTRSATRSSASSTNAPQRCSASIRCGASGSSPWCRCPAATPGTTPWTTPWTTQCGDWAPPPSGSPTSGGCAPRTRLPHGLSWWRRGRRRGPRPARGSSRRWPPAWGRRTCLCWRWPSRTAPEGCARRRLRCSSICPDPAWSSAPRPWPPRT